MATRLVCSRSRSLPMHRHRNPAPSSLHGLLMLVQKRRRQRPGRAARRVDPMPSRSNTPTMDARHRGIRGSMTDAWLAPAQHMADLERSIDQSSTRTSDDETQCRRARTSGHQTGTSCACCEAAAACLDRDDGVAHQSSAACIASGTTYEARFSGSSLASVKKGATRFSVTPCCIDVWLGKP